MTPVGLLAAEADGGAGLRMLVERAGGNIAKTLPKKLPAADTQVPVQDGKVSELPLSPLEISDTAIMGSFSVRP